MPGALPIDILSPSPGQSRVGFERIPQIWPAQSCSATSPSQ